MDSGSSIQTVETPKAPESKPENMNVDIAVPNDVETRPRNEEAPATKRPLEETTNSDPVHPKRQNRKKGNKDKSEEDQENVSQVRKMNSFVF